MILLVQSIAGIAFRENLVYSKFKSAPLTFPYYFRVLKSPKNKFDLLWLGFSIVLILTGGFFIVSGIFGIVARNNQSLTSNSQIDTVTSPTPAIRGSITTTPTVTGQVGNGISTVRTLPGVDNGTVKAEQTNQFIEQTGKWVATDYVSGDIAKGNYTVKRGDTLWEIAEAVYGSGSQWTKIRDSNKSQIRKLKNGQQALIVPGQVLIIK